MPRKISKRLLSRLTIGDLNPLLNHIKKDKELRLEVRTDGKAFVYYRKGKALEIRPASFSFDKNYIAGTDFKNHTNEQIIKEPQAFFKTMKKAIDLFVESKKTRNEFDSQQLIARENQDENDKYIIIDMEYSFSQAGLDKTQREKRATFDLLAIERKTGNVVFVEVKKGRNALVSKAGIKDHILDFETMLFGKNKNFFRKNLEEDIKGIVTDKTALGLCNYSLPLDFEITDNNIDFIFVYEPDKTASIKDYEDIFEREVKTITSRKEYVSLYVSEELAYKLK